MIDDDEFEKMMDKAEGVDPRDKQAAFARKLARMTDQQFRIYAATVCSSGDAAKAEEASKPPPDRRTEESRALDKLSNGEMNDYLKSIGVNSNLVETTSDRVYRDKKRHVGD